MNAQQIITFARTLSKGVTEAQIDNTEILVVLNKAYKDFYKKINNLDRNYFWDSWKADTVEDQYEYSILQPSGTIYGMFKPEKIRIKYTSKSDYVDITFKDWDSLENTPEFYAENQSTEDPFAIMTDNKYIHIFPTPTEAVTDGLIFEGAKKPYDLVIGSLEGEIIIDPLYHEVIAYMMCPTLEKKRGNIDGKNDAINEANIELSNALRSMGLLTTKAVRCQTKDLSGLE